MYLDYNKKNLVEKIEKISIEKIGNQVITKYDGHVISVSNVSNRYEIFDIRSYLKSKIDLIESNFSIKKYQFLINKGVQELRLLSDEIDINGTRFQKVFFILNSSDKSRRLSFDVGIKSVSDNFYIVFGGNLAIFKKHLTGISSFAEEKISKINDETFINQIENIKKLVGHKVSFSNIRNAIIPDPTVKVNHLKFDSFKNSLYHLHLNRRINLTKEQISILTTPSIKLSINTSDFYMDAFDAFMIYMKIFSKYDSHIIKNETDRIMKITQYTVRQNIINSILNTHE